VPPLPSWRRRVELRDRRRGNLSEVAIGLKSNARTSEGVPRVLSRLGLPARAPGRTMEPGRHAPPGEGLRRRDPMAVRDSDSRRLVGDLRRLESGSESRPAPALTVRLLRPDVQSARVMALFQGTRAASPREALAAGYGASDLIPWRWARLGCRHRCIQPRKAGELRGSTRRTWSCGSTPTTERRTGTRLASR